MLNAKLTAIMVLLLIAGCGPAATPVTPTSTAPSESITEETLDLSGPWRWSVDPYADGYSGFHGGEAGYGSRRYNFINVEDEMRKDPTALFEYDMQNAKTAMIPGAWVGHEPEMRHYHGTAGNSLP